MHRRILGKIVTWTQSSFTQTAEEMKQFIEVTEEHIQHLCNHIN